MQGSRERHSERRPIFEIRCRVKRASMSFIGMAFTLTKLAHDIFPGPWQVVNVALAGLAKTLQLNIRQVRKL